MKNDLSNAVVTQTIELYERILNSKLNKTILPDGREFYRGESHVLVLIGQEPGIFSSEIARRYKVTRAVIYKTLKKLETEKYIRKEIDETDKKRYCLYLTSKGEEAVKVLTVQQMNFVKSFFDFIDDMQDEEKQNVLKFLTCCNDVMENL